MKSNKFYFKTLTLTLSRERERECLRYKAKLGNFKATILESAAQYPFRSFTQTAMSQYHALPIKSIDHLLEFMHPMNLPESTYVDAPATSTMFDFKYLTPPTIRAQQSINDATAEIKVYNLPFILVVNDDKQVLGVLTSDDILGEKPVQISQERRIARHEIEASMLMRPVEKLLTINIDDLQHAKIGHVIQTLRETKQHIILVTKIDADTQQPKIRGLFSASIISRQLDKDITLVLSEAKSIAELQRNLQG